MGGPKLLSAPGRCPSLLVRELGCPSTFCSAVGSASPVPLPTRLRRMGRKNGDVGTWCFGGFSVSCAPFLCQGPELGPKLPCWTGSVLTGSGPDCPPEIRPGPRGWSVRSQKQKKRGGGVRTWRQWKQQIAPSQWQQQYEVAPNSRWPMTSQI